MDKKFLPNANKYYHNTTIYIKIALYMNLSI